MSKFSNKNEKLNTEPNDKSHKDITGKKKKQKKQEKDFYLPQTKIIVS